jgi:hypothetical protein
MRRTERGGDHSSAAAPSVTRLAAMEPFQSEPSRAWSEVTSDAIGQAAMRTTRSKEVPNEDNPTGIEFRGDCPLCTHEFVYVWPLEVLRVEAELPLVMCQCTFAHQGRPKDTKLGCGAYWVSVPAS